MVADQVVVQTPQGRRGAGLAAGRSDGRSGFTVAGGGRGPCRAAPRSPAPEGRRQGVPGLAGRSARSCGPTPTTSASRSSSSTGPRRGDTKTNLAEPQQINEASAHLDPAQGRDQRRAVQGVLPPRRARLRRAVRARALHRRGHALLHGAAVRPEHAAVRPATTRKRRHGVKLYVRRVFITEDLEALMPRYLRFVSGVVDSEDLQLNVSRETLQHGAVIAKMRKALVRRLLDELAAKAKPARRRRGRGREDRDLRQVVGPVRRGAEGGPLRGCRQPAEAAGAGPLPQHRTATAGSASPTMSRG